MPSAVCNNDGHIAILHPNLTRISVIMFPQNPAFSACYLYFPPRLLRVCVSPPRSRSLKLLSALPSQRSSAAMWCAATQRRPSALSCFANILFLIINNNHRCLKEQSTLMSVNLRNSSVRHPCWSNASLSNEPPWYAYEVWCLALDFHLHSPAVGPCNTPVTCSVE